ncbi:ABC transporter ATP-binding protein [Aquabacter spiritensis]|uniref:NitT/TauT family transport system ATP-binding protein n=1 Tax=Aquabacter spiritensis TaxID=933073 RepID=A0A4R3LYS5_9HYPH|nr:NitT/TauT family transport system ATP-binding protein [Aquabacter spiritensis]
MNWTSLRGPKLEVPAMPGPMAARAHLAPAQDRGRLAIQDLSIAYGEGAGRRTVVERFSLDVAPGEFVCVLGPSGCGKSTVLNVVAGFVPPSRGRVMVDGEPITAPGADRGMVFQQATLFPWKSVLDNVAFGPLMTTGSSSTAEQTARTFLSLVGLAAFEKNYPMELSGGMQQRVGIARALANYPRVLLMDEPFGALDAQTRAMMQEALLNIWAEFRTTVLFITHDIEEAIFLGDRVVVMGASPGRIVADIPVDIPRPRSPEDHFSDAFVRIKRECFELIRAETMKAFEQQSGMAARAAG